MALHALSDSPFFSPEEYVEGEKVSDIRHEYIDGQVFAMAGESRNHNMVCGNIYLALRSQLRNSSCRVFMENVKTRIKTGTTDRYYYPDIQVGCGGYDGHSHEEREPKVIIEVLSSSTERKDRADKFFSYRELASLREYVLVAQDTRRLEIFRRDNNWEWELYTGEEDEIKLKAIDATLKLADLYEGVELPEPPKSPFQDEQ
jgi:Uma2 family endonuclease